MRGNTEGAGWRIVNSNIQRKGSIALEAAIRSEKATGSLASQVTAMEKIVRELSFE